MDEPAMVTKKLFVNNQMIVVAFQEITNTNIQAIVHGCLTSVECISWNNMTGVMRLRINNHIVYALAKKIDTYLIELALVVHQQSTYTVSAHCSLVRQELITNSSSLIKSPINGRVIKIMVKPGDDVQSGQPLLVIEAMKMENIIAAEAVATIAEILVDEGVAVKPQQVLVRFA